MSNGLQVFDDAGTLMFDTSDRLARYVTTYTVSVVFPATTGTVTVAGLADDGTWLVFPGASSTGISLPIYLTIGSGSFTWTRYAATGSFTVPVTIMRV